MSPSVIGRPSTSATTVLALLACASSAAESGVFALATGVFRSGDVSDDRPVLASACATAAHGHTATKVAINAARATPQHRLHQSIGFRLIASNQRRLP